MKEITQEEFDKMLAELAKKNWKIKNLLDSIGYDGIPQHLKEKIDELLGVERRIIILKKSLNDV